MLLLETGTSPTEDCIHKTDGTVWAAKSEEVTNFVNENIYSLEDGKAAS